MAIVAGSGDLPRTLADGLVELGYRPFVVIAKGEADPALAAFDHVEMRLEDAGRFIPVLKAAGITHIVLAGGISRRPALFSMRPTFALLTMALKIAYGFARGDDALLRVIINAIESQGFTVVGAHEILPGILAERGAITAKKPSKGDLRDIEAACTALRLIGTLDLGQAAVAVGGRVVAIEGPEGTDMMLSRVAAMKQGNRIPDRLQGVVVKCAKPDQELRADLPTIGPRTIENAVKAGLRGVAVEAGRALILNRAATLAAANKEKIFVYGVEPSVP